MGDSLARSKVSRTSTSRPGGPLPRRDRGARAGHDPEELVTQVSVTNPETPRSSRSRPWDRRPLEARDLAEAWIRAMVVAIDGIEGTGVAGSAPVTVIPGDSASLPSQPLFPDVQTAMIVGGVLGLGFGVAFALIRTVSDRRVRARRRRRGEDRCAAGRQHPRDSRAQRRGQAPQQFEEWQAKGQGLRSLGGASRSAHQSAVHGRRPPAADHRRHQPAAWRRQVDFACNLA